MDPTLWVIRREPMFALTRRARRVVEIELVVPGHALVAPGRVGTPTFRGIPHGDKTSIDYIRY